MVLTESEVDKLVAILNHILVERGYKANRDGFTYDDDLQIVNIMDGSQTVDFESGLDFMIDELGVEYSSTSDEIGSREIADILYNMSLDMDYMDSAEHFETEINLIKIEIDKLKSADNVLFHVLEAVACNNTKYLGSLTEERK